MNTQLLKEKLKPYARSGNDIDWSNGLTNNFNGMMMNTVPATYTSAANIQL
jgi:hypothetical protein